MRQHLTTLATLAGIAVLATGLVSRSFAIGGAAGQTGATHSSFNPDPNHGRFVALGGEFGNQRFACVSCHQLDGTGDRSGAFPRLTGQNAWYIYTSLQNFASGERPNAIMQAVVADLSDRDMQDVAAFYAIVGPAPYPPPLNQDKQTIDRGQEIAEGAIIGTAVPPCATCHGMKGEGKSPIYPALGGQFAPYLEQQLRHFKSGERKGDPMGIMETIASKMSDDDIHAVSLYYASLSPQEEISGGKFASASSSSGKSQSNRPHFGATRHPEPGKGSEVVPGASTEKASAK